MTWICIRGPYRERLHLAGLRQLSDFMNFSGGKILKSLPSRTVLKVKLSSGGETKTFFIKRHRGKTSLWERGRTYLSGFSQSPGRKEWDVIHLFQEHHIPTVIPVASGENLSGGWQESFVMTEELSPSFESLQVILEKYGPLPLTREKILEKRLLIRELSGLAGRMHAAGFNHRDFYCGHIFLRSRSPEEREWCILDLQRVDRRRWFRMRWIVKDLAALNYSAPPPLITLTDRLRFLQRYLGENSLREKRSLLRRIIQKTEQIRKHDQKLQRRRSRAADALSGSFSS